MDHYDEDLFENIFFQTLQKNFPQLYEEATEKRWMITVPRCGTLESLKLELQDFESHILLPVEDKPTILVTVNHKTASIRGSAITTRDGFEKKRTVAILFEETFFNRNNESYRVLCISQPLERGIDVTDDSSQLVQVSQMSSSGLYSYNDCCQILWGNTGNRNTPSLLTNAVETFLKMLSRKSFASLKGLVDLTNALFKKCMNIVLKDRVLKHNAMSNLEVRNSIAIAAETYIVQHTYHQLFRNVCSFMADRDEKLNRVTRNIPNLHLRQLNVRQRFCQHIPRARTELSNVVRLMSPTKKLNCIKRVLTVLISDSSVDASMPAFDGDVIHVSGGIECRDEVNLSPFGTDDLLPILVFLVMKTEIPNWWSQWAFMKHFCLAMPVLSSEYECYLSNLEAALVYITSAEMRELRLQSELEEFQPVVSSPSSTTVEDNAMQTLEELFQKISVNDQEAVAEILKDIDLPVEPPSNANNIHLLCHPLCDCAKCRNISNCSNAVQQKSHVGLQFQNDRGMAAIHVASIFGHIDIIDLLLEKHADVNATEFLNGQTPLHLAAQRGHQKLIMLFLHHNALINQQDKKKNTALHLASANGHNDCVKALIYIGQNNRNPVDLDLTNDANETALHMAAKWGFESIVAMLIEHGASPCIPNRKNQMPLDVAHNSQIYKILFEAFALERGRSLGRSTSIKTNHTRKLILVSSCNSNLESSKEKFERPASAPIFHTFSPLTVSKPKPASFSLLEKKIEKLLKSVADGDIQMVKHHLEWSEYECDHPEVNEIDVTKMTLCHPLCQCSQCWYFQKLTLPLTSGIHLNCQNDQGFTPLHVASLHGHLELVHLMLRRGAWVKVFTNNHRYTPLHCACKQSDARIVKLLVDYGAEIMMRDSDENTALHHCCLYGNAAVAWYLLQIGSDVNAVNRQGNSPLHIAIRMNSLLVSQMLIHFGADLKIKNQQMQTPSSLISAQAMTERIEAALIQRQRLTRPLSAFDRSSRLLLQQFQNVNANHPNLFLFFKNRRNSSDKLDLISDTSLCKLEARSTCFMKDDSFLLPHEEAILILNRYRSAL